MPRQAATTGSLPRAFEVVKEMQADGPDRGEGCRPLGRQAPAGIIEGRDQRVPGSSRAGWPRRSTSGATPSTPAPCATGATALLPDRSSEGLRKACPGDRPCDPGRRRAGALDPQGRRGPARPARAPGPGRDGEPGRQDARPVGRGIPPPALCGSGFGRSKVTPARSTCHGFPAGLPAAGSRRQRGADRRQTHLTGCGRTH